jgi:hypothetical protein
MEAESSGIFWKETRRLADAKPAPISVAAPSLKNVFEKRLNPPPVLPLCSTQHSIISTSLWLVYYEKKPRMKARKVSSLTNGMKMT